MGLRSLFPRDSLSRALLVLLIAIVIVFVGGAVSLLTWATPGWSAPAALPRPQAGSTYLMDAAVTPVGTGFAVWDQTLSDGHRLYAAQFLPDMGWTIGIPVDEWAGSWLKDAHVAVDARGDAVVVWSENYAPYTVWANRYLAGSGWSSPTLLSSDDWNMTYRAIPAMDAAGNAIAVWSKYGNDPLTGSLVGMTYSERLDASTGWQPSVFLGQGWVSGVVLWADGTALATLGTTGGALQLASLERGAGPWSPSTVLNGNESTNGSPILCDLGEGRALAAWEGWNGSVYAIRSSSFVAASGWSTPMAVPTVSANGVPSALACDSQGSGLLVWSDDNWGARNLGAAWWNASTGWSPSFLVGVPAASGAEFPVATLDAAGNAIVVWSEETDGGHAYMARVGHGSSVSSTFRLDSAGGAGAPTAGTDSEGDVLVVWSVSDGTSNAVWSRHFFAAGSSIPRISWPWVGVFLGGGVVTAVFTVRWWRRELSKPLQAPRAPTSEPPKDS